MQTTLKLDESTLQEAMSVSEGHSEIEVVHEALRRYIRGMRQRRLLDLRGRVEWQGDVDALRERH